MTKPTFASVTEELCTCSYLERMSSEENCLIRFDASTNEYEFSSSGFCHRIHHCPFCGGVAPASKRPEEFVRITFDEEARLARLMEDIKTTQDAIHRLGNPERTTEAVHYNENDRGRQQVERLREFHFESLSPLADVCVTEHLDGTITYHLQSKWLETSKAFDWSTVPRRLHPDYLPHWKKLVLRLIGVKHGTRR